MSAAISTRCATILVVYLLIAGGCGRDSEQYETVPVSGVITCQGKPIANATVNFTPLAAAGRAEGRPGRVALGITDQNGRFRLTTYENDDGAIVGRHRVTVSLNFDEKTGTDTSKAFPCRDSSMEVTVERDMGEIKIEF